jgi:hypothetical protein
MSKEEMLELYRNGISDLLEGIDSIEILVFIHRLIYNLKNKANK